MQIIRRLESLRGREHAATCELIETLATCHRTKAHLDAGYASVWDLLVRRLQYSPAAASRRHAAMKFALATPRALDLLRAHRTNLTALAKAVSLLRNASADAVLDAIADKSGVEVERAIAEFRPWRPPVERVRRVVVVPKESPKSVPGRPSAEVVDLISPSSTVPDDPNPTKHAEPAEPAEIRPSKTDLTSAAEPQRRVALSFTVDESTFAGFERAKAIVSRKRPVGLTLEAVFEELVDFYLAKKAPKDRPAKPAPPMRSRHIPTATRDHVLHRDGLRCSYVGPDGTRCGTTYGLQIDHILPWSRGGTHDAANLRVLCGQHNRRRNEVGAG